MYKYIPHSYVLFNYCLILASGHISNFIHKINLTEVTEKQVLAIDCIS